MPSTSSAATTTPTNTGNINRLIPSLWASKIQHCLRGQEALSPLPAGEGGFAAAGSLHTRDPSLGSWRKAGDRVCHPLNQQKSAKLHLLSLCYCHIVHSKGHWFISSDKCLLTPVYMNLHICTQGKEHCISCVWMAPVLTQQCMEQEISTALLLEHSRALDCALSSCPGLLQQGWQPGQPGCVTPLAVGRDTAHVPKREHTSCPGRGEQSSSCLNRMGQPGKDCHKCPQAIVHVWGAGAAILPSNWPLQFGMIQVM